MNSFCATIPWSRHYELSACHRIHLILQRRYYSTRFRRRKSALSCILESSARLLEGTRLRKVERCFPQCIAVVLKGAPRGCGSRQTEGPQRQSVLMQIELGLIKCRHNATVLSWDSELLFGFREGRWEKRWNDKMWLCLENFRADLAHFPECSGSFVTYCSMLS